MIKRLLWSLLLILVACGPATEPEAAETAVGTEVPPVLNEEEVEAEAEAAQPVETATEAATEAEPEVVVEIEPEEEVETAVAETTEQQQANTDFSAAASVAAAAEIRSQDWTKGTDTPRLSIIEYGDFQ